MHTTMLKLQLSQDSHLRLPDVVAAGPVVMLFPSDSDEEVAADDRWSHMNDETLHRT